MLDMDRMTATEFVHRKLVDRKFLDLLTAEAEDGSRPIVIAMREDLMESVVHEVVAAGGTANVFVPYLNGFQIMAMHGTTDSEPDEVAESITASCTVGVFMQRVTQDGGGTYGFVIEGDQHRDAGSAALTGIAS